MRQSFADKSLGQERLICALSIAPIASRCFVEVKLQDISREGLDCPHITWVPLACLVQKSLGNIYSYS